MARILCPRCERPPTVCYCAHLHALPTRTRVILLQHPREEGVKVGTARMAHLCLPNSVLRVGTDFATDPVVAAELADLQNAYVLFPAPGARHIDELRGAPGVKLVVLDGTWREARKLFNRNPFLHQLPTVAFTPAQPSGYRIRREPAAHCVSTIEALAEALSRLEPEGFACDQLLEPFRAMVDRQLWFTANVGLGRSRHRRKKAPPRERFVRLREELGHILCIQGEANAWALQDPRYRPPAVIHWVAHRPATGDTYEALVAPSGPVAPLTPRHVSLSEAQILAGVSQEAWQASWQAFLRPDDLLLQWGHFYTDLAKQAGLALPGEPLDLRLYAARELNRRCGTVEALLKRVAGDTPAVPDLGVAGRAGKRLATLVALVKMLAAGPGADPAAAPPA